MKIEAETELMKETRFKIEKKVKKNVDHFVYFLEQSSQHFRLCGPWGGGMVCTSSQQAHVLPALFAQVPCTLPATHANGMCTHTCLPAVFTSEHVHTHAHQPFLQPSCKPFMVHRLGTPVLEYRNGV